MGLYAEIDIVGDWGFPFDVTGGDDEIGYESVPVDYSNACRIFVSTFMEVATKLVPVDTGYLRSTINADTDWFSFCYAEATADYAQYVEYGTWCMEAQPYFEIALEEACAAAGIEAQNAVNLAQEELEAILSSMMKASVSAFGGEFSPEGMGSMSFGSWLGSMATFALMFIMFFPVLVNLYGIIDSIGNSLTGGGSYADSLIPEVIIT